MLDVWSGARGWLTPPMLFVFVNVVIGTIAVMSKLMSSSPAPGGDKAGQQRSLMRAPSAAFDRFRCFSFSRLGLPSEQHAPAAQLYPPLFDDDGLAEAPSPAHVQPAPAPGGFERRASFLRAPSFSLDRLRGFSFSRRGPAADDHAAPVTPQPPAAADAEPSHVRSAPAEARMDPREPAAHIERSQSEAAAEAPARRRRGKKTRKSARAEGGGEAPRVDADAGRQLLPPAVEVNERADDFIRQFREQLRLQRLDSILRSRDTLRRTETC